MNIKVQQYIRQLDDQFNLVKKTDEDELKSMLTQYLCVRVSGLLETFVKCRISDYTDKRVPKEVNRYISGKFKEITNLNTNKIKTVLNSFSNDWSCDFDKYLTESEQQKNSVDSLITHRHNIAHGQSQSISLKNLEQYYEDVKILIKKLENIIK